MRKMDIRSFHGNTIIHTLYPLSRTILKFQISSLLLSFLLKNPIHHGLFPEANRSTHLTRELTHLAHNRLDFVDKCSGMSYSEFMLPLATFDLFYTLRLPNCKISAPLPAGTEILGTRDCPPLTTALPRTSLTLLG